jgi:chromosome segregation protein
MLFFLYGGFVMRLKKLTLAGFKSFAEKTVLHFDAGITCIVGPNGCGKSNIADAFRWVLGEQSAKSMRGSKMPDIIFAGTSQRKALNVAEVSLTLTDIGDALPIDYEEVTLTRRLHRNGESEYLLNGNAVRLKDLQSLFLDSGVGRNAFSIFEQGKLDQVISYSPIERRHIFEEAAGILRFLQRKREALKRLEQADLNLSRVKDIHREVEQQIETLKTQAEKAKHFKANKELLERLEKDSYVLRWSFLEKKGTEAQLKQQKLQIQLQEMQQALQEIQARSHQIKVLLQQDEKLLRTKSEELFKIRNEKEIHARDHLSNQQRLEEARQKEKKIKRELEDLKLAQQSRQKALVDIHHKQKQIEADFQTAEKKVFSQRDHFQLKEKVVAQLRQEVQIKQQEHLKLLQSEGHLATEMKQNETRLEHHVERKNHFEVRKSQINLDVEQIAQLIKDKKQQLAHLSGLIDTHKDRLDEYEDELKVVVKEIESKQREMEIVQRKMLEQRARQKVLQRLREEHEGFSSGSKRLLQEANNPNSLLYNMLRPLYEILNPTSASAPAVAVILRHYSQTLVVENEKDLKQILEFTQKENIQDYSLLCASFLSSCNQHPFLQAPNPIAQHLLSGIKEVKGCKEAVERWQESLPIDLWSQEGIFIDHKGVFFHVKANENQVFLRESELKSLEEELLQKDDQITSFNTQLGMLQERKSKRQLERLEVDKLLRRDEMKLVEVNFGLQRSLADLEKIKQEQSQMEKDLLDVQQQIEQLQGLMQQTQQEHSLIKRSVDKLHEEILCLNQDLEKQMHTLQVQQQDQKESADLYQQLSEDRQKLIHQLDVLEIKDQEYQKQEQHFLDELVELEEIQAHIQSKAPQWQQSLEAIEARLEQAAINCTALEQKIEKDKEIGVQVENEVATVQNKYHKGENELNQLSMLAAQHHSAAQSLEHELQERYQLTITDAKQQAILDKSLEQTEKQIRALRQALQSAGDINMAAIEDLEKHEARHTFLKQQVDDMAFSKEELLQIIEQVDGESRKLFRQTFDVVRENFKKNFQILFNGGEADLQFTDTENILEAGIDIIAKPPGKQMRSISLLSGGEKCLTAVALLFAIFEVKPAPFCILDEIDAPLDDTNVERFTNVVKHFVNRCQFLIITHNKRTMAMGDMLFGISMEEKGISKLLALEFAAAAEEAPEASLVS